MLWLKGCPRCGGDLYDEWEPEGQVSCCLQCGWRRYPVTQTGIVERPRRRGRPRRVAALADQPGVDQAMEPVAVA